MFGASPQFCFVSTAYEQRAQTISWDFILNFAANEKV